MFDGQFFPGQRLQFGDDEEPSLTVLPTLDYRTSVVSASNLTTYSFSSVDIGAADDTRLVIVAVAWGGALNTLVSGTIGGVAATVHVSPSSSTTAIMSARVPTGTTATISITLSAAANNAGIGVWRAINLLSATPVSTAGTSWIGLTASNLSVSLNIPAGGIAIANGFVSPGPSSSSDATERYDAAMEATEWHNGYDYSTLVDEAAKSITINNVEAITGASWR